MVNLNLYSTSIISHPKSEKPLQKFKRIVGKVTELSRGGTLYMTPDHWCEFLDTQHRHPLALHNARLDWQNHQSEINFFDYLSGHQKELSQKYPELEDKKYQLDFWTDAVRKLHEVIFKRNDEGEVHLYNANGSISDGKYMFIYQKGKFYFAKEVRYRMHHSSLAGGQAIDCAGVVTLANGTIKSINLTSGHYLPSIYSGMSCLRRLEQEGVNLSQTHLKYFDGTRKKVTVATCTEYQKYKAMPYFSRIRSNQALIDKKYHDRSQLPKMKPNLDNCELSIDSEIFSTKLLGKLSDKSYIVYLCSNDKLYISTKDRELEKLFKGIIITAKLKFKEEKSKVSAISFQALDAKAKDKQELLLTALSKYGLDLIKVKIKVKSQVEAIAKV